MDEDLIDDAGFELGLPSLEDMLRHECDLLECELEVTRRDLRRAHQTIGGMIVMHRDLSKELSVLKVDHQRVTQRLSECYAADREREISRMGYSYGDHAKKNT